jgi:hypothetical protein
MSIAERKPGEGRMEYLSRLGVAKSLGFGALTAAGAVLMPPLAPALVTATILEGLSAGGFGMAHSHLKGKRQRQAARH